MTRIDEIANIIRDDERVIDIGCDSAKLGQLLARRNIRSIASDLRQNVITTCINKIDPLISRYIDFRVGNGFEVLHDDDNITTAVLSGMGTHLMLNIIGNNKIKKIITISNNDYYYLRKEMVKKGYKISFEKIIKEKSKYYNLIVFVLGKSDYTYKDLYIGINHIDKMMLKEYATYKIHKLTSIISSVPDDRKIELIKEIDMLKSC